MFSIQKYKKMSIENISVQYIKGVGGKTAQKLEQYLKIKSVKDLLYYFPREWEDRAHPKKISELKGGERATVRGKVENVSTEWRGRYLVAFKSKIKDSSGTLNLIWLRRYTRSYDVLGTLKKEILKGCDIFVTGTVSGDFWEKTINVQEYEVITGDEKNLINANRIVPVYPLTKNFTNKFLRTIIKRSIEKYMDSIAEIIPEKYLKKYELAGIKYAVQNIHFPETFTDRDKAKNRLAFDEFLDFQLKLEFLKQKRKYEKKEFKYTLTKKLLTPFKANLPFELTAAQKNVINEIFDDMLSEKPMNRLLQGDVGSGKTVVALSAMLLAVESGFQSVLLAPTEILAEQHFLTIKKLLKKLDIEVGFIVGQMSRKEKKDTKQKIADGTANIIIGTHTLLEEDIKFKNLSLVVIDEQHRFGVEQRLKMRRKTKFKNADFLLMSATPIPRTLGLTLYGDLDISTIKELPPGRIPIKTLEMSDKNAYNFIREKIVQGEQAFIVYPLVDESEKLQLKSAIKEAENLRLTEFKDFSVGLIYGRMKPEEKDKIMSDFAKKKYQILISTTVIESGIDISNATVMVIEHAERYGLSTLHQLRGRVGRSDKESHCILIGDAKTENAKTRLDVLTKTTDGFKIAEEDLKLRGPGEFFGTDQSGIPEFNIGNILTDYAIIQQAKQLAIEIIQNEPALVGRLVKNQNLQKLDLAEV